MPIAQAASEPGYGFKILIHQNELDNLAGWVLEHPDRETGGDLFGFWTHSASPTVQLVLGPGPGARHEVASFFQDADHLRRVGEEVQGRYGLQHIGDWHSHHQLGLAVPSGGDATTARRVFSYTDFPRFVLCIANICPDRGENRGSWWRTRGRSEGWSVDVGAFLFERDKPNYRKGLWVVLPDPSPVADSVRRTGIAGPARQPSTAWRVPRTVLSSSIGDQQPPVSGWYTETWGTTFLRGLDDLCRDSFADCGMSLLPDTGELTYALSAAGRRISVRFPPNFPVGAASVSADAGPAAVCEARLGDDSETFFEQLVSFVDAGRTTGSAAAVDDAGEESADGLERGTTGSPGAGESNPEVLLPDAQMAQSDRVDQDVPRGTVHD